MTHPDGPAGGVPDPRPGGDGGARAELLAALDRAALLAPGSVAFADLLRSLRAHAHGGKLLRPRLVELGYRVAARGPVPAVDRASVDRLGASFELLHTALLMHDDVIDRDTVRRGRPTLAEESRRRLAAAGVPAGQDEHAGMSLAIVGGDALLTEALRLAFVCDPDPVRAAPVAAVVFDAATATAAGELEDVLLSLARHTGEEPSAERILDMQRLKTAAYTVEAPLRAGALLGGADASLAEGLAAAGADLGVAYQVVDDVLGVFGSPDATGKPADGDLREGKATLVTAHGRRDPAVRALLDRATGRDATRDDVDAARRALDAAGSRGHALSAAADLVHRGRVRLAALPMADAERADLDALCRDILERRA